MPYQKLKEENFLNFGGINTKVSPYEEGPTEFLNLSNYDFAVPGALSQRPGSTQYLSSSGSSGFINGLFEFVRLSGLSMPIFAANTNMYYISSNTATSFQSGLQNNSITSFSAFADRVFFCNGANIMKWDGLTSYILNGASYNIGSVAGSTQQVYNSWLWGLPAPPCITLQGFSNTFGFTVNSGMTLGNGLSITVGSGGSFTPATYVYSYGYVNDRGFRGPPSTPFTVVIGASVLGVNIGDAFGISIKTTRFNIPASYGIGASSIGSFNQPGFSAGSSYVSVAVYRDNGSGGQRFLIGYCSSALSGAQQIICTSFFDNGPGSTFFYNSAANQGGNISNIPEPLAIQFTLAPKWLEVYNNQLFMAGFSAYPSTSAYSDIGEPESIQATNNFDVRTNDGDRISGMKNFFSKLFFFKENSFHALSGDNPSNFYLREISNQYGCISGRAIATYENFLCFLDKKGVVRYNGANIELISNKVESIFKTLNLSAPKDTAVMVHDKIQNKLKVSIPTNGATLNNLTMVYDYLLGAWTKEEGYNLASGAVMLADQTTPSMFYGNYSSMIFNFHPSLTGDNGAGITLLMKSRFTSQDSETVTKMFRQLFLNVQSATGATMTLNVNLYADHNSSVNTTFSMVGQTFQLRSEFGIPAKSLSVEIEAINSSDQLRLHGYALSTRFMRNV